MTLEPHEDENTTNIQSERIDLFILALVKDHQQQHGLRHGDYQRYRGYCSRRIRRLRKVLKLVQTEKRHYKRRDVTESHLSLDKNATAADGATDPKADCRYLHLPLMLAERCWAYAQQLRQEANTEPRKKFQHMQKLRRACSYAASLEQLCSALDVCSARTKLEAQAYSLWLVAQLQFELQKWQEAAEKFKALQLIYGKLGAALVADGVDDTVYRQRIDEVAASLRFCLYNIGGTDKEPTKLDVYELRSQGILDTFEALSLQTKRDTLTERQLEVNWHGVSVTIGDSKVRTFIQTMLDSLDHSLRNCQVSTTVTTPPTNDESSTIGSGDQSTVNSKTCQSKLSILENFLLDLRDIITHWRDNMNTKLKQDQILLSYLVSIRVERTSQRNLLLVQQTRKAQDRVRLMDIVVQQVTELTNSNEQIRMAPSLLQYYEQLAQNYRTLRVFYVARMHMAHKRYAEAAVLYERASMQTQKIAPASTDGDCFEDVLAEVRIRGDLECACARALHELQQPDEQIAGGTVVGTPNLGVQSSATRIHKSKKPLVERLDEFRDEAQLLTKTPNVVTCPPPMEPLPAKPLFYDLALNYCELPNLQGKLEGESGGSSRQTKGLSGFVKGLWSGWGGK